MWKESERIFDDQDYNSTTDNMHMNMELIGSDAYVLRCINMPSIGKKEEKSSGLRNKNRFMDIFIISHVIDYIEITFFIMFFTHVTSAIIGSESSQRAGEAGSYESWDTHWNVIYIFSTSH